MITKVSPAQFLALAKDFPLIDVRTPAEYAQGHIPTAHTIALFSNDERAVVGTIYKQQGKEHAIAKGLEFVGPRMHLLVEEVAKLTVHKTVLVHCWRGGMRSGSVAWLLGLFGYTVYLLEGGYKAYRTEVLTNFKEMPKLLVIGGPTGSGKSKHIRTLKAAGKQVIDLEALAKHKGSVFGGLDKAQQPTQEQFENDLAHAWNSCDADDTVYIEDESRKIGAVYIPEAVWLHMRRAPVQQLEVERQARVAQLVEEYGNYSAEQLKQCVMRLQKQLGGLVTAQILALLDAGDITAACDTLLHYYDERYAYGFSLRSKESCLQK